MDDLTSVECLVLSHPHGKTPSPKRMALNTPEKIALTSKEIEAASAEIARKDRRAMADSWAIAHGRNSHHVLI
jgi:hypothetical protein